MVARRNALAALYRYLATGDEPVPRLARALKRRIESVELRPPTPAVKPLLYGYVAARDVHNYAMRLLVCQPFFRAYCKQCGPNLRTDGFIHWVEGQGDIIVGANCWFGGRSTFLFAARFSDCPTLMIGDNVKVGHDTTFVVGKRITVGNNVIISGSTSNFDSNSHPSDPVARRLRQPPRDDEVRPVTIGDDVWIGKHVLIFPGVQIGEGAIVSAGAVVRRHIPPRAVVAGNPAQIVFRLGAPVAVEERPEIARRAGEAVDEPRD